MERFVIEALKGVSRHPVEGVRNGPFKVKGFSLRREGGYIPIGGLNDSWLGEQGTAGIAMEEPGDVLAAENGDLLVTEWEASPDLSGGDLLMQDETSLAFLSDGRLWYGAGVASVPFGNTTELALAPRAALLAPWRIYNQEGPGLFAYQGGAVYEDKAGSLSSGTGPGVMSKTENAGTGVPEGTYEFLWTVEAPTTNGLVVHSVGYSVQLVASGAETEVESVDLALDTIFPAGTLIRFYYRGPDQGAATAVPTGMEFFGAVVSDGQTLPSINLGDPGTTFFVSDDVLMNFAPGRLEAHNGRMWGAAGDRPFQPIISQYVYQESTDQHMLVAGGPLAGDWQSGAIATGNHSLQAPLDYVRIVAPRLSVRRVRTDIPTLVPVMSQETAAGEALTIYLQWDVGTVYPRLIVETTSVRVFDEEIPHSALVLGLTEGSQCVAQNVDLTVTYTSLAAVDATLSDITISVDLVAGEVSVTLITSGVTRITASLWAAWTGIAEATTLYLGRLAPFVTTTASFGNREWRVTYLEAGDDLAVFARGSMVDYDSNTSETTWTSSSPNAETWTVSNKVFMVQQYIPNDPAFDPNPVSARSTTLVYSSVGSVNRGSAENFLPLSPLASKQITALASTPAGLLIFMDSETFLVRGDPATPNSPLNVQRLTGTLGCDPNVIPARLGSVVMPIYQGEIYAVSLGGGDVDFGGGLVNISKPVWDPDDPFVQVVGEPIRNHLVARTNSGRVYRLDTESQEWINDVFDEQAGLRWILSAGAGARYGVRYNVDGYLSVLDGARITTPEVSWDALDLGDKNLMKLWRRMEVYTEGEGDGAPTLTYTVRGATGTVTGLDQGGGRWIFTLPRGIVGAKADLLLKFPGATHDLVVEPPVAIEFQPRYRER